MLILYGRNVCGVSNITKMNSSIGNDFTTNIKNIFKKHTLSGKNQSFAKFPKIHIKTPVPESLFNKV